MHLSYEYNEHQIFVRLQVYLNTFIFHNPYPLYQITPVINLSESKKDTIKLLETMIIKNSPDTLHIIYTRNSSLFTLNRTQNAYNGQQRLILHNFPMQKDLNYLTLNECCKSDVFLLDRKEFKKIIMLAMINTNIKIILYMSDLSRLGRYEIIFKDFMEINQLLDGRITINFAIGNNLVINLVGETGDILRQEFGIKQSQSAEFLAFNLANQRLDGAKRLESYDIGILDIIKDILQANPKISILSLYNELVSQKIVSIKGKPYSKTTLSQILKRNGIRNYSTNSVTINEPIDNLDQAIKNFKLDIIYLNQADHNNFYKYINNIWVVVTRAKLEHLLYNQLKKYIPNDEKIQKKVGYYKKLIKVTQYIDSLTSNNEYVALQNGILNLSTLTLVPFSRDYYLTYKLPYNQIEGSPVYPTKIKDWLHLICNNNTELVEFFMAYINCILRRDSSHQIFLELFGPGGGGKSTFVNLIIALVGKINKSVTDLNTLENNKFETANFYNKALIVINDSSMYKGGVSILKALTGGDPIRNEVKMKQASETFVFSGLVVIISNELLMLGDQSSGLTRRLVIYKVDVVVSERKVKLEETRNGYIGELSGELEAFFNLVIKMDVNKVNKLMKSPKLNIPTLKLLEQTIMYDSNPVAKFIRECVIVIGSDYRFIIPFNTLATKENSYKKYNLYRHYETYKQLNGLNVQGQARFKDLFQDNLKTVFPLTWKSVEFKTTNQGLHICGIVLRDQDCPDKFSWVYYDDLRFKNHLSCDLQYMERKESAFKRKFEHLPRIKSE